YCSGAVPSGMPASAWSAPLTLIPYHGSGYVPASLNVVSHGMLLADPSQNSSRFGSLAAALQLLVIVLSIDAPPNTRAPPGRRVFRFSSMLLYQRFRFGSVLSTFCTALAFAVLTL